MYGLIFENIVDYIKTFHGDKSWEEIRFIAGIEHEHFQITTDFSEGQLYKIIWALQDVTGESQDKVMEDIGTYFHTLISKYEYNKVIRVVGRTFTQFLNGLDNLHEYLKFTFPNMRPPSFYCEHESRTGLTLHYRSKRRGFYSYVKGIIKFIGKTLYDTDVTIELLDNEAEDNMQHVIMRLHFNNLDYGKNESARSLHEQLALNPVKITSDIFFNIFPFIIVFNRGMRIRNIGLALFRSMPRLIGKKINHDFVLIRPFIRFRWEEIMSHSNNIFELMSIEPIFLNDDKLWMPSYSDERELQEDRRRLGEEERKQFLTLKGQMKYMEEWESICFLGIPVMTDLNQMYKSKLFINDFATHDSSRDLILASTQQAAELKLLLDQEEVKREEMNESMGKLHEQRARTDKLLYQLLPRTVADQLRKGGHAANTSETFDSVTVLFTDIVGFTTICSKLQPMDVVDFLNNMYNMYDDASDRHNLFKVETIGDAYMAVSGAPNRTPHHAEYTCDCALDLVELTRPFNVSGNDVRIRAGVHTGSVVAGVVGVKMPRYCLFGENVLIANKMESSGSPMRVQVSERTERELNRACHGVFEIIANKDYEYQPGKTMKTYWLEKKNGPPRPPTPFEEDVDDDIEDMKAGRRASVVYTPTLSETA